MKYASIDIGTNTLRLLVAELTGQGALVPLVYERRITRLGGGYTDEGGIASDAAERTLAALETFRDVIDRSGGVEAVYPVATSVVRRARNRDFLIGEARRRAGLDIEVIPGAAEARLSLTGVLSVVEDGGRKLVMDIGGGSTEFIVADGAEVAGEWSMEMGVVHLTESRLAGDPPEAEELAALAGDVEAVITDLTGRMAEAGLDPAGVSAAAGARFVGTAGTVTTLAAVDQDLERYDRDRINNYVLTRSRIGEIFKRLSAMTLAERSAILSLEKGREDLIIPGAVIAMTVMDTFGFDELVVSDAGLLEGVILDRAGGDR